MLKTITLSIRKSTVKKARKYAQINGLKLSGITSSYLEKLACSDDNKIQISAKLKKIIGAVQLPDNFNEEVDLRTHLENKNF